MAVLAWSRWRRWHQAWARYYHYRRRGGSAAVPRDCPAVAEPVEVLDVVWRRLEALLPPAGRGGRPYTYDRRTVLEAIVYVMQTGCGWRELPDQFPPWQTVYAQLRRWKETGIWDHIWTGLNSPRLAI